MHRRQRYAPRKPGAGSGESPAAPISSIFRPDNYFLVSVLAIPLQWRFFFFFFLCVRCLFFLLTGVLCKKGTPSHSGIRPAGKYANSTKNSFCQNNVKCKPCRDESSFSVANAS